MEYIAHRINTSAELAKLPNHLGVELDLRDDYEGRIYISHNPYERGEFFEDYLKQYHHGTMILNIKSERIEFDIIKLLKKYSVKNYIFLDSTFPMIYLLSSGNEQNIALRVSEFEGIDTARNMAGRINWIWLDCFSKIPIGKKEYIELKSYGYRICFVSPELEGRNRDIETYAQILKDQKMSMDAICTKPYNIERWEKILNG